MLFRIRLSTAIGIHLLASAVARADISVNFTIDITKENRAISPLIYGSNSDDLTAADGVTFRRSGGNRLTGYNWENNASHAGTDWNNSSDSFMGGGETPGKAMTDFHDQSLAAGQASVITLPAAGYVSKDKKGTVTEAETAPSARWAKVVFAKGSAFTATPDVNDGEVYTDEFVDFMVKKYPGDKAVKRWEVDNEPGLWKSTHPRIHPLGTGAVELIQKTTDLAVAVKKVDPQSEIFGGVFYGYNDYASLQDAPDWKTLNATTKYPWYIDYFLDQMKKASDKAGKRLLDVLDVHWYSEATGDHRINDAAATTDKDRMARLQAPRSLWDDKYVESSWISQWATTGPINLLPRLQASIDKYYPGTRIAVTEYNYGEATHVTGGIANADLLGVLAKNGVYAADFWQLNEKPTFVASAFRLFRNYDGQQGRFGSMSAQASASDRDNASVFASFNPGGDEIHIIALNKNPNEVVKGTFTIATPVAISGGKAFGFDKSGAALSAKADAAVSGNVLTYNLPPWSATHFVLKTAGALPAALRPINLAPARASAAKVYLPDGRWFPLRSAAKSAPLPLYRFP